MIQRLSTRLWENVGTLLLAFALAFAVWISAVVASDPNEERNFPRAIPLEIYGLDPAMVLIANLPDQVNLSLSAPSSLWDRLINEIGVVQAYLDVSGLESGEHTLPVQVEISLRPVRIVEIDPQEVEIALETRLTQDYPVTVLIHGEPAAGFQADPPTVTPSEVSVSGPQSLVDDVEVVQVILDISAARESISSQINLEALDGEGNVITGVSITPQNALVNQNITQAGGYRDVAVKVETIGLPATGFRVINITVTPPIVTLFSNDVQLVAELPGFVSTHPLDLTGVDEDLETRLALDLPDGVTVEGEQQNVEVIIGIAAIESSIPLSVQVEVIGLAPGANAVVSPESAGVILSGPLTVLESLLPGDVRLLVDLSDLEPGTHLLEPQAEILPDNVQVLSVTPSSVEVIISLGTSFQN